MLCPTDNIGPDARSATWPANQSTVPETPHAPMSARSPNPGRSGVRHVTPGPRPATTSAHGRLLAPSAWSITTVERSIRASAPRRAGGVYRFRRRDRPKGLLLRLRIDPPLAIDALDRNSAACFQRLHDCLDDDEIGEPFLAIGLDRLILEDAVGEIAQLAAELIGRLEGCARLIDPDLPMLL
jgi:hypothetical protein